MKAFRAGLFGCLGVGAGIIGLLIVIAIVASSNKDGASPAAALACSPSPCAISEDGWSMYVTAVERNVVSPNPYEHTEPGNHFVRVAVRFGNDGGTEAHVSDSDFVLQDAAGVKHDTTTIAGVDCGWTSVNITTGGSFGPRYVCFEAGGDPKGALALVWTPRLFGNDYSVRLQ